VGCNRSQIVWLGGVGSGPGSHPSFAQLAGTFHVTDEIYAFTGLATDNQVVMTCEHGPANCPANRLVSQHRSGPVFLFRAGASPRKLDRTDGSNVPNSRLVEDHFLSGLLWAMKR
jgi:hypothetical protein